MLSDSCLDNEGGWTKTAIVFKQCDCPKAIFSADRQSYAALETSSHPAPSVCSRDFSGEWGEKL